MISETVDAHFEKHTDMNIFILLGSKSMNFITNLLAGRLVRD